MKKVYLAYQNNVAKPWRPPSGDQVQTLIQPSPPLRGHRDPDNVTLSHSNVALALALLYNVTLVC